MRQYGTGSIYYMADRNKWRGQLIVGKQANGKDKVKNFYGQNKSDVQKQMRQYQEEAKKFDPENIVKLTLKEYFDDWLETSKKPMLKPASFDRLERTCEKQIFPYLGIMQFAQISDRELQIFLNERATQLSYSSTKKIYECLNAVYKLATARNHIQRNPMLTVILPVKAEDQLSDIRFFTTEEIQLIKTEAVRKYKTGKDVYRLGYAYILLLNTGMRAGEALALTWQDIDFDKRTISVSKSVAVVKDRTGGEKKYTTIVQDMPKTKKSIRLITMNNGAYEALTYIKNINGDKKYVLARESGNVGTPRLLDKAFRLILKHCDITPSTGVHSLRHTFASILFKNGVDVKTVSELLGHSSTTITYNTYIHLIQEQKAQAVKIIDAI